MNNYVVIDIETSGLDERSGEIICMSALKVERGEILDRVSSLCKPIKPLTEAAEILTGITEDLNDKPTIIELLSNFLKFIGAKTIVAHNVLFDVKFINAALEKANMPPLKNKTADIYALAKEKCELESYEFYSIAEALGVSVNNRSYLEIVFRVYEKLKNLPNAVK